MDVLERKWKTGNLKLFPHQHAGVKQMEQWLSNSYGGIMADEMGLGKTAQTVVLLSRLCFKDQGPFLVVAPLSVCDHWTDEVKKFSNSELAAIKYTGYEAERRKILEEAKITKVTVFITAPHILIKDETLQFLQRVVFSVIVVDEAHCIKNQQTQLARCLRQISPNSNFVLLTGTPIQNNLSELYSLLSFADRNRFPEEEAESFVIKHKSSSGMDQLKTILAKYMLRRTKGEVFSEELAKCEQVVLYHGVSEIQKGLYKNIISKNTGIFVEQEEYTTISDAFQDNNAVKLTNILIQLRKAVIHPYMFQGIEPEPFEEGEHLVDASGKLQVLDRLMRYCFSKGHRCLVFSQFLGALDIVEDFLKLRKWNYERLDGTCRSEERTEKITSFQKKKTTDAPLCFLLSTKAGGVGLTLTAADTVVFLDSDWNPQNDIQAMARCHRIGQTKAVRVIRLVARFTVDQYVVAKARDKLKLTDDIMGTKDSQLQAADVVSMLRNNFGLLMQADSNSFDATDSELELLIGKTQNGEWQPLERPEDASFFLNPDDCDDEDVDKTDYCNYEGVSYRGKPEDWDRIMESKASENKENLKRKRESKRLREDSLSPLPKRKRQTKEEMWAKKGYVSNNLSLGNERDEDNMNQEDAPLKYVFGDVTRPGKYSRGKDLILHCVDNGGVFGTGGVFNAIRSLDSSIENVYETAGKMRNLHLGDAHLCPVDLSSGQSTSSSTVSSLSVVLLVAQGSTNRRVMKPGNLESCLRRVSLFAKENGYRIHTPRLGKGCDISWYMVDRLLKKHFSLKGIPCFVYYHPPSRKESTADLDESQISRDQTPEDDEKEQASHMNLTPSPAKTRKLRRRTEPMSSQNNTEDDKGSDTAEESSDESSASENEWTKESEQEEETDEEMELEQESDKDEEHEDTPVNTCTVKKTCVSPNEQLPVTTETKSETPKKVSEEETEKPKTPKSLIIDGVDLSVLFRKKVGPLRKPIDISDTDDDEEDLTPVFKEEVVSVYGLQCEEREKIRKLVKKYGGTVVFCLRDLHKATFAAVPRDVLLDFDKLELFRTHFDKDCHLVHPGFIHHATGTESLDDLNKFVL